MNRQTVIEEKMLEEFKLHSIEDTPQNRIEFLTGIQEAWNEDETISFEKSLYKMALSFMIGMEKFKLNHKL